ncbi:hypothetical protein [Caballeronia temeraria]|uniref:hypothetical protein n=1 Tax=Caballeronia temeraria TaxID=1777137 RepID=UPI0012FE725E|nr:hypothetical protein [Caballeronia temeraria]
MRNDAMDFLRASEQDGTNEQAQIPAGRYRRGQRKSGERAGEANWAWAHQIDSYDWMDRHDLLWMSDGCASNDASSHHVFPMKE